MPTFLKALLSLFFLAAFDNFLRQYGDTWTIGRYGMPRSIVSTDGRHNPNGTLIDPLSQVLIDNDAEELVELAEFVLILVCGVFVVRETRRLVRNQKPLRSLQAAEAERYRKLRQQTD